MVKSGGGYALHQAIVPSHSFNARCVCSACSGCTDCLALLADLTYSLSIAHAVELMVPEEAPVKRFDFEQQGLEGWKPVRAGGSSKRCAGRRSASGCWSSAPWTTPSMSWRHRQRLTRSVDVSVRFKPMAGREDASGGIVFRCAEGRYYVVRANALENNVRLYYYDRGRHQLATARVQPPALGQWHTLRVVAVGDHMQSLPQWHAAPGALGHPLSCRPGRPVDEG